jgi:threonine-phosphate decarboxylase
MTALAPLHGGQLRQIADRFGIPVSQLFDFSANINPEGPPLAVLSVLRAAVEIPSTLTDYPDLDETELRQSLARYASVRPETIAVANGFVPLLDAALRMLTVRRCLVPVPAFVEYRRVLERCQVEMIAPILAADSDFSYNPADLFAKSCEAMLLANPQNPSGVLCTREPMFQIVEEAAARNIYVLLDEAFMDYCPEDSLAGEIDRFPNLIVFRSVTKFFGMAGLRVAYAIANAELSRRLQQAIPPWSVTTLASLAACAAVKDEAYARRAIALNIERRNNLQTAIRTLGFHVYPAAANFLLFQLPGSIDGQHPWEYLIRQHHLVLRNCANYEGLGDGHLRAAVRTSSENERVIEALAYAVEQKQWRAGIATQSG